MAKDERLPSLDTEPPPPSGDAYSAETVQRQIPPELLAAAKAQLVPRAPKMPTVPRPPRPPAAPPIAKLTPEEAFDDAETKLRPMDPRVHEAAHGSPDPILPMPAAAAVAPDRPAEPMAAPAAPFALSPSAAPGPSFELSPSPNAEVTDAPAPKARVYWSWMVFLIAFVAALFVGIVLRTHVLK